MIHTANERDVPRFRTKVRPSSRGTAAHGKADADAPAKLRPSVRVAGVTDEADWEHARTLILEHLGWIATSLGVSDPLTLQTELPEEMADLRGVYTPPHGRRYLAWLDEKPVGTVGFAIGRDSTVELRRLYVRPAGRGRNLGELLVRAALAGAAAMGCRMAWLETMPGLMETAIAIYQRLGFQESACDEVSVPGAIHMTRPLTPVAELPADTEHTDTQ